MLNTKADNQDLEQKEYLHKDSLNEQGILKPEIREDNRQETLYENKTQTTEEKEKECRDICMHCGMHCIYLKKD